MHSKVIAYFKQLVRVFNAFKQHVRVFNAAVRCLNFLHTARKAHKLHHSILQLLLSAPLTDTTCTQILLLLLRCCQYRRLPVALKW
jgi:hypothetical protein